MGRANEENYFFWDEDTLIVNILGRPGATKDAIGKPQGRQLKVSVTASPQQGRATDHMLRFLAPLFGVRERDIELVFGRESVHNKSALSVHKNGRKCSVIGPASTAPPPK